MDQVHSVAELIEKTSGMPLERMRFFINEDRREPRCFGIYRDPDNGHWVVYKNKADGSRAVRYSGPDEGYAAQELWAKINSEISLRRAKAPRKRTHAQIVRERVMMGLLAVLVAIALVMLVRWYVRKPHRGYYLIDDDLYYYQDSGWYWYDDGDWGYYDDAGDYDWYHGNYCGEHYDGFDSAGDAFEQSGYYVEPSRDDDDDNSIFDDWDIFDTD